MRHSTQERGTASSPTRSGRSAGTELPFGNGDLVAEGVDLDVLLSIADRQQPQRGEGIRDGEIGKTKERERS